MHRIGSKDGHKGTNHKKLSKNQDTTDLIESRFSSSSAADISSDCSLPSFYAVMILPFSCLWTCLSSISTLLKHGLTLQFLPNKTIKKRRNAKTLPAEHPTRVSLRLRGFNAENEGIVQNKRTRQRKRNIEHSNLEKLEVDIVDETIDRQNEASDFKENLEEEVSFVYWAYCKLMGKISEDNVLDDNDDISIPSIEDNCHINENLTRIAINKISSVFNCIFDILWKICLSISIPFQLIYNFFLSLTRHLQNLLTTSKEEKAVKENQNIDQSNRYSETEDHQELGNEKTSMHPKQYSVYSDSEEEYSYQIQSKLKAERLEATPEIRSGLSFLEILRAPFSFITNVLSRLIGGIKNIPQLFNWSQTCSKKLILRKEEDPERLSKRLRGVAPEELKLPTTRRRSRRLSGSSVNSRMSSRFDAHEPINEVSSSDDENTADDVRKTTNGYEIKRRLSFPTILRAPFTLVANSLIRLFDGIKYITQFFSFVAKEYKKADPSKRRRPRKTE